ncbi:MAG: protein kinase [Verrucomicrobia bacterium]|nr:protein kinase [Verrucomicrobiota bacterium]
MARLRKATTAWATRFHQEESEGIRENPAEQATTQPAPNAPQIPDFELLRCIGRGSYGEVWLARNVVGTYRAVKIIERKAFQDEEAFEREFSGLQRFEPVSREHDGFVAILHVGRSRASGYFYYVMELADDDATRNRIDPARYMPKTLSSELARCGRLSVRQSAQLGLSLSKALAELHWRGLVHRDVKPSNIIFVKDHAKLADIGLVAETGEKNRLGTEGYIPPEGPGKPQADLYSLGMVLYEASTGRDRLDYPDLPEDFDTMAEREAFLKLNSIILKACDNDVRNRYQTATQISDDLTKLGFDTPVQKARRNLFRLITVFSAALLGVLALALALYWLRSPRTSPVLERSIAVLPFENLSTNPEDAYFAEGIQEEILTRLAKITDLRVISRTSTRRYQSRPGNLSQIARQLGVANIVEGSVQKAGNQARVNAQLINARTDSHLWAESYDRKLSDLFQVESDVAQKIAAALEAKLTGHEKIAIAAAGARNPEAYDAFLHALTLRNKPGIESKEKLREFCRRAVERDSNYAEAWAVLGIVEAEFYFDTDHTNAQLTRARTAAETALRLAPESADAHSAMGIFLYYCLHDFDRALTELNIARERAPNDANVILFTAWVKRRQGKLDEAIDLQHQAAKLDPLNEDIWINLARSYRGARRFGQAHAMLDRALTIVPGDQSTTALKAETYLAEGDLDAAARLVEDIETTPNNIAYATSVYARQLELLLYRRQFDQALAKIAADVPRAKNLPSFAIALIDNFTGSLHADKGDLARARPFFQQAQRELRALREQGHADLFMHAEALVEVDARLGDRGALESDVVALLDAIAKDSWRSPGSQESVARAYAILRDADRAVPLLKQLLTIDYDTSITPALLRLDPVWDSLRSDPDFQQLCEGKQP